MLSYEAIQVLSFVRSFALIAENNVIDKPGKD